MFILRWFAWWNAKCRGDATAVKRLYFQAVASGQLVLVRAMIRAHGLQRCRDSRGQQAIHIAALHGHLSMIKYLVHCCDVAVDVTAKGATPLAKACYGGRKSTVRWLLQQGADRNAYDVTASTVLMHAVANPNTDDDVFMLQLVARDDLLLDATNQYGYSALLLAASLNKYKQVHYLIGQGASIYTVSSAGFTLAHFAKQHRWNMGVLLEHYEQTCYDRQQQFKIQGPSLWSYLLEQPLYAA